MPKNEAAIRAWVTEHRPDLLPQLDALIATPGTFALLAIGFESGREFQRAHPESPPGPLA